jgi:hypothetical protein
VGEQVFLDLPELGATGVATVKFIGPCPHIDAHAPGNLVTGTFKHEPDEPLLTITVAGSRQIEVGCTESHPFWSEDRQDFVPARDLRIGECLRTRTAGTVSILKIAPRPQEKVVYNLEVLGEHVYEVSELGILVHNAYNIKLGRSIHWSDLNPFQGKGWTEWQGWSTSFDPTKLDSEFPIALNETLTKVVQNKGTIYFNTRGVAGDTTEALQSFTRLRRTRSLADASGNSNNITTEYEWRAVIQDKDYRQYAKFVMSDGSVLDYSQYYDQILRHLPFEQTWGRPP